MPHGVKTRGRPGACRCAHVAGGGTSRTGIVGPARTLLAATYVDNLIVFGRDASGVEAVLALAQGWLRERWAFDLADSPIEVLVPVGMDVTQARLKRVEKLKFLGD